MVTSIAIETITRQLALRRIKASGVAQLKESIARLGFQSQHPILVLQHADGTCELLAGRHRLIAAQELGLTTVPAQLITEALSDLDKKRLARQDNEAAEVVIPTTFVDDAELIWQEAAQGHTQQDIAQMLGWSRDKVARYAALREISAPAWQAIVTVVEQSVSRGQEQAVTPIVTAVTFTENLLREILPLLPDQQLELVQLLASHEIKKARFTDLAHAYRARNEMVGYACQCLGDLGERVTTHLHEAIRSGAYDADWKTSEHPQFQKLLTALREEWEQKHAIHLIYGDFQEEVQKLGDGCIDLIVTDPPYNITRENEFELEDRSNISQNFGAWDRYDEETFLALLDGWAIQWARLLRPQGSGYVFLADRYLSDLRRALAHAGLQVKATLGWYKPNPGPQIVKTNYKSSLEYILFFTKGQGGHTFNWQGDEDEMHNLFTVPICSGHERLVDRHGNTLHPTQKPERLLRAFIEVSSNRGDTIFDGFAGVGSTGKVAKDLGRKFIGIEREQSYFEAMQRRLAQ